MISASLLAADKLHLVEELKRVENSNIDLIHFDVMDNVFVPNESFNDDTFKKIREYSSLPFEIHLMVSNPFLYLDNYDYSPDDVIIVHYESFNDEEELVKCINDIRKKHRVGLTIKPNTDVKLIVKYLSMLDYVLIMSVEPGFGGQKFMPSSLDKIKFLKGFQDKYSFLIEVDGGINNETGRLCIESGADILVSGSYLFNDNMKERALTLLCEK